MGAHSADATNEISMPRSTRPVGFPFRAGQDLVQLFQLTMEHDTATYSIDASTEILKSGFCTFPVTRCRW